MHFAILQIADSAVWHHSACGWVGRGVEMDDPKNGMREMDDLKMWYPLFVVGVDIRPWEWGGGVEMDG